MKYWKKFCNSSWFGISILLLLIVFTFFLFQFAVWPFILVVVVLIFTANFFMNIIARIFQ